MLRDPISVYVPSIEAIKDSDAFIVEHPAEAIKKGSISRVPWMTGVTSHEGLIVSATIVRNKSLIEQDLDGWKALASHGLYYKREDPAMTEAIKQEYFGNAKSIADIGNEVFFQNLTTLFSDRHFFSGFQQAAISHASHADVYLYFLNYPMEFRLTEILLSIKGETHVLVEVVLDLVTRWFNKTFFGILPNFHGK
jgi:carboxylesterase type B